MNLLQPFCVVITASYRSDAIYSLTVPPCDGCILHPGYDEFFMSRIFLGGGKKSGLEELVSRVSYEFK